MKNTLKILMCLVLAFSMLFGAVSCGGDGESTGPETVVITFDYSQFDADCDEDEKEVEVGKKIGTLPKATLSGYTFKGWFVEEDFELLMEDPSAIDGLSKVKTSWKPEEDTTLYAWFVVASSEDDGPAEPVHNCNTAGHRWVTTTTAPTCNADGTKTMECEVCHYSTSDAVYKSQNPALGHQWVEEGQIDDGGWTYMALARYRKCYREGCAVQETKPLKNITSYATMTCTLEAGAWPGMAEWPSNLTDNKWDTGPNGKGCAPKGGGPLTIQFIFNTPSEIDQLAMSVAGLGDRDGGNSSKFEVYFWYAAEDDFREDPVATGYFESKHGTKEGAYCIDRTMDDQPLMGIKIVLPTTRNGEEMFREFAIAVAEDAEE